MADSRMFRAKTEKSTDNDHEGSLILTELANIISKMETCINESSNVTNRLIQKRDTMVSLALEKRKQLQDKQDIFLRTRCSDAIAPYNHSLNEEQSTANHDILSSILLNEEICNSVLESIDLQIENLKQSQQEDMLALNDAKHQYQQAMIELDSKNISDNIKAIL